MEQDHFEKKYWWNRKNSATRVGGSFSWNRDQGHLHAGHKPAKEGKLHLKMLVVSDEFLDLNQIERHQKVYFILTEFLADKLHALSLETYTVSEYNSR